MTERLEGLEKNGEGLESAADGEEGAGRLESGWDGYSKVIELKSTHHEVWEKGEELARAITKTLHVMGRLER
jgi:hypothetical protein